MNVLNWTKQNAPTLLKINGAVTGAAATGLGIYNGTKLTKELEDIHAACEAAEIIYENHEDPDYIKAKKSLKLDYAKTMGLRVGVPVALTAASTASWLGAFNIVKARNAAEVAALNTTLAATEAAFGRYRRNVVADAGEDKDFEYFHGFKKTGNSEVVAAVNEHDPEETCAVGVEEIEYTGETGECLRFFDEHSRFWVNSPEYNLFYLRTAQAYMNSLLQVRGTLMLSEVLTYLDLPVTKESCVYGWTADQDTFVDFGLYTAANERVHEGCEANVILCFNADIVYHMLPKEDRMRIANEMLDFADISVEELEVM